MNYGVVGRDVWESPEFGDLTPEEKFFALWTLTAPQARKCGCWPLNKRIAAAETGYNTETIDKLVGRLQEAGWLSCDQQTREVLIKDWGKRNAGLFKASPTGKKANSARENIIAEWRDIKSPEFKEIVASWLANGEQDPPSTPRQPPVDGGSNSTTTSTSTEPELDNTPTVLQAPGVRSSASASPPKKVTNTTIPENILNLIPEDKRVSHNLDQVAAALDASSAEIVAFNIIRALGKAKEEDPWSLVFPMLTALGQGTDWYAGVREITTKKTKKNGETALQRQQEQEAGAHQMKKQNQEQARVLEILENLSIFRLGFCTTLFTFQLSNFV